MNTPPKSFTSDFYSFWRYKFAELSKAGAISLPQIDNADWMYWFQQWATKYSSDYDAFKELINSTIAAINETLNTNAQELTDHETRIKNLETYKNLLDTKLSELTAKVNALSELAYSNLGDPSKLNYLSLSFTYSANEPDRFAKLVTQYTPVKGQATLINMCNISDAAASDVTASPSNELQSAIDKLINAGFNIVMIKPHVGVNRSDGFNKTSYKPNDVASFFSAYKQILLDQAALASKNKIDYLCLETELNQLVTANYMSYWTDIVTSIKNLYPDIKITVASAGAYQQKDQSIFALCDTIGINWYPVYFYGTIQTDTPLPDYSLLSQRLLTSHINDNETPETKSDVAYMLETSDRLNKPIWITETGVSPKSDGLANLVTKTSGEQDNYNVTSLAMTAMIKTLGRFGQIIGFNWWSTQEPFNLAPEDGATSETIAINTWKKLKGEMLDEQK